MAASWRDAAIEKSEAISDAWDVAKAYAGRAAEWVLFGCMFVDILEMLPGNIVPASIANGVLAVQAITLDVAGFGLQSLADHAERSGDEKAANTARRTGTTLIGIMILTLVAVTLPLLWPGTAPYTALADKVLILVRVVMTVIYGHVMHSLRQYAEVRQQQTIDQLRQELQTLRDELARARESFQARLNESSAVLTESLHQELASEFSQIRAGLQTGDNESSTIAELRTSITHIESSLKGEMARLKSMLDRQAQECVQKPAERTQARPMLRALPTNGRIARKMAPQAAPAEKFDARAFVYACLEERADMKLSEIAARAKLAGQELSEATSSRYRKQFFASRESELASLDESSPVVENASLHEPYESSASEQESLQMKASNQ